MNLKTSIQIAISSNSYSCTKWSFSVGQINSLNASLTLFYFAVVCDPKQIPAVESALRKCYDHISRLYAYNKAEPVHPGKLNVLTKNVQY